MIKALVACMAAFIFPRRKKRKVFQKVRVCLCSRAKHVLGYVSTEVLCDCILISVISACFVCLLWWYFSDVSCSLRTKSYEWECRSVLSLEEKDSDEAFQIGEWQNLAGTFHRWAGRSSCHSGPPSPPAPSASVVRCRLFLFIDGVSSVVLLRSCITLFYVCKRWFECFW